MTTPIRPRPPPSPATQIPADEPGRADRVERARAELEARGFLRPGTEHDPAVVRAPDGRPIARHEAPRPRGGTAIVGFRRKLPGDSTSEGDEAPPPVARPDRSYSEEPEAPTLLEERVEELEGELIEVEPARIPRALLRPEAPPRAPPPAARAPPPRPPPRPPAPAPPRAPPPRAPRPQVETTPPTARELWRDLSRPGADPVVVTRDALRVYLSSGHVVCALVLLLGLGALAGVGVAALVLAVAVVGSRS